jgi:hypothetical protein
VEALTPMNIDPEETSTTIVSAPREPTVSNVVCTHLDEIAVRELPASVEGCEDCLRTGASGSTSGSA